MPEGRAQIVIGELGKPQGYLWFQYNANCITRKNSAHCFWVYVFSIEALSKSNFIQSENYILNLHKCEIVEVVKTTSTNHTD